MVKQTKERASKMQIIETILINTIIILNTITNNTSKISSNSSIPSTPSNTRKITKVESTYSIKPVVWRKIDSNIYGGEVEVTVTPLHGAPYTTKAYFRLDGRNVKGYRVDTECLLGHAWVAIDDGYPLRNLKCAKSFVKAWLKA